MENSRFIQLILINKSFGKCLCSGRSGTERLDDNNVTTGTDSKGFVLYTVVPVIGTKTWPSKDIHVRHVIKTDEGEKYHTEFCNSQSSESREWDSS